MSKRPAPAVKKGTPLKKFACCDTQSPPAYYESAGPKTDSVNTDCATGAGRRVEVKKEGPNKGRIFYSCSACSEGFTWEEHLKQKDGAYHLSCRGGAPSKKQMGQFASVVEKLAEIESRLACLEGERVFNQAVVEKMDETDARLNELIAQLEA